MSAERPQREVAQRLFAAEFEDSEYTYAESDEERAPNYVVTPTGARVNRLFVVGVLTEVEPVSDGVLRARVVDPTGAFVVYAGQYQPEALAFFERTDPPAFVAVTGKARTFQPDDSDVIYTSIRPESANEVTAETRDHWVVQTAERTIERVETFAASLDLSERGDALERALRRRGVRSSLAAGIPAAIDYYGTTRGYLQAMREMALDATRVVADDLDEVESPTLAPGEGEDVSLDFDYALPEPEAEADVEASATGADSPAQEAETESVSTEPDTEEPTETDEGNGESAEAETATEEQLEPSEAETGTGEPDEMYELSEEEREEVKSEYGVDFETGNEVAEPGEADIETPDTIDAGDARPGDETTEEPAEAETEEPEEAIDEPAETEGEEPEEATDEPAETEAEEPEEATEEPDESEAEPPEAVTEASEVEAEAPDAEDETTDVDLEDAVVETMEELDEGDGAPREELVETVVDRHEVTPDAVEEAIQDALMGGRCYEPAEGHLTPI